MPGLGHQKLYIVVPAYNEADAIGGVVHRLRERFDHVVVVDDGSVDQTGQMAQEHGATVVTHLINRGQGAAIKTGIDYALHQGAEVIVTFDSDGQHQVEDIETVVRPVTDGSHDVALGSRFLHAGSNVPPMRKMVLKLGVVFTRLVSGVRITDTHNGFRAFSRGAAARITIHQDRMAHASEILDEIGRWRLRYCEVPTRIVYTEYSRRKGQSSWAAVQIAMDFLLGRWRK